MARSADKKCIVRFEPSGLKAEVAKGSTVLEAAHKVGVYLSSICGGDGYCGKCKVVVSDGHFKSRPTGLLTPEEIREDIVLACQTKVLSDMTLTVPKWHRLEAGQILTDSDAKRFGDIKGDAKQGELELDSLVQKIYLEMNPPSIKDHTADHERLYHSIRENINAPIIQTGFRVLQKLSPQLKKADYKVTVTVGSRGGTLEVVDIEAGDRSKTNFAVAVDLGTTTVVAHLIDLTIGKTVDTEATYNSQISFGEDYIRRIIYGEQNNAFGELQNRIVHDVNDLIVTLAVRQKVDLQDIIACVCAGNTAMVHFLLNLDSTGIRREPFSASASFVPVIRAAEAGVQINKRGLLYCLPGVAAYVGSDIVAGVLATGMNIGSGISLLADIGTNGEVVLGNKEWMVCASSSAGPAFEGSGVKHGMRAGSGAIEKLRINEDGSIEFDTVGNSHPIGICGSGLLDTLAELYKHGIIDRTGRFCESDDKRLTEAEEGLQFQLSPASGEYSEIVITQADIDNLIRSKAGVFSAIRSLLKATQLEPEDLESVYLAGGFGNFLDINQAIVIGMLPDVSRDRIHFVGNTTIAGAKQALLSRKSFETCEKIAESMTYIDLMSDASYMEEFIRAKFIPHTDLSLFPSVKTATNTK